MRAKLIIAGSALVLLLILLVSCHKKPAPKPVVESTPPIGKNCTVQLRRDALGTAASSPVPPLTGMHNGAETAVAGKLKLVTSDWVVLDRPGGELWIPKHSVLLLQY
jgi:hypothetical protein